MLQAITATQNGQKVNIIWFAKALGFVFMQYKPMVIPSSALHTVHNNEDFVICSNHID